MVIGQAMLVFLRLATVPCEGPGVDPWITEIRDRVMAFDQLAKYAVELYGLPLSCDGSVTDEFDGRKFGVLRLVFAEGVTFRIETMPPETSIITLRSSTGFDDEDAMRQVLETYSVNVGLRIDWTAPTEAMEDDERIQAYWDPDSGVNGSASLVYSESALVAVRFSMAL